MENYEETDPELPEGLSLDDLRFVDAELYAIHMAMKGWEVGISHGVDGNPAKVRYNLSRTLSSDFDPDQYWKFLLEKGIAEDADAFAPGYSSLLEGTSGSGAVNESPSATYRLTFKFEGFPTNSTMDNLVALEKFFHPESSRLKRLLGKLGVRN